MIALLHENYCYLNKHKILKVSLILKSQLILRLISGKALFFSMELSKRRGERSMNWF